MSTSARSPLSSISGNVRSLPVAGQSNLKRKRQSLPSAQQPPLRKSTRTVVSTRQATNAFDRFVEEDNEELAKERNQRVLEGAEDGEIERDVDCEHEDDNAGEEQDEEVDLGSDDEMDDSSEIALDAEGDEDGDEDVLVAQKGKGQKGKGQKGKGQKGKGQKGKGQKGKGQKGKGKKPVFGSGEKKISGGEQFRLAHFKDLPRAVEVPGHQRIKINKYDPTSFKVLDIGTSGVTDVWLDGSRVEDRTATPEKLQELGAIQRKEDRRAFFTGIKEVLTKHKERAQTALAGMDGIVGGQAARKVSKRDIKADLKAIAEHMPYNTTVALGRPKFRLKDLRSMATVTPQDLKNFVIYLGVDECRDGTLEAYTGSSSGEGKSGRRLLGDYEMPLQYLKQGIYHCSIGYAGLAKHAALPHVVKTHLRVLCSFEAPGDEEECRKLKASIASWEGVFMDYLQTIGGTEGGVEMQGRRIQYSEVTEFSKSMAPSNRIYSWRGLNKMHPMAIGAGNLQPHGIVATHLEARSQQDGRCPLNDCQIKVNSIFSNPLKGYWKWMTQEVVCQNCYDWARRHLVQARACTNLEELRALRQASIGTRTLITETAGDLEEPECVCGQIFDARPAGMNLFKCDKPDSGVECRRPVPAGIKDCACFGDAPPQVCHRCYQYLLRIVSSTADSRNRPLLNELKNGCSFERFCEMMVNCPAGTKQK